MGTEPVDLAALAAIWVERWLTYGGGLIVDANCDKIQISMREDGWSWRHKSPNNQTWNRLWHDGWVVGRWRELNELAQLVPGLREAIIDHVALNGALWPDGGRAMWRAGAEAA